MARQLFHFFAAGPNTPIEKIPHLQFMATNVIDAWLNFELYERNHLVAREFRELPIKAFDSEGNEIATRTYAEWHAELYTYGDNYQEVLDHAASLM